MARGGRRFAHFLANGPFSSHKKRHEPSCNLAFLSQHHEPSCATKLSFPLTRYLRVPSRVHPFSPVNRLHNDPTHAIVQSTPEQVFPTAQRICTNRSWFILASNFAMNSVHKRTRPPPASACAGSDTNSRSATVSWCHNLRVLLRVYQ